ncbi:hypothetical protein J2X69_003312 [Algoriphagus sp. 4150]|uniref:hypothetical protein n=1 Tax=Algoriphagus sp. 4150 TaxID=2817756 RepID=UPI002860EC86|nr:hypothetical protein [Algoriphagus sp. 4150]MDR7130953.1 hypothetical protein [Algoriphagus sp. 4150]
MGKIGFGVLVVICFGGVWLYTQFQGNSVRNEIVFEDNIKSVADSLAKMDQLLQKFPTHTTMVNYFMDREGYLYLGAEKIAPLKGAINNPKVRENIFFENFTDDEINQFFYLMAYLLKNKIDAANLEKPMGRYLFNYRRTEENRFNDMREIMIVENPHDTSSLYFKETFQILDQEFNLVLFAPKKAEIR